MKRKITHTKRNKVPDVGIRIHGELYKEIKSIASKQGMTLSEVIKDLLAFKKENTF